MALDQSTPARLAAGLLEHVGHETEIVFYGPEDDPVNVAIECITCGCVLIDADVAEET